MTPPRIPLGLLPTPLHRLERASAALGFELWMKRDDLTGFALGGNKVRKLEYLIAEALASGATTVVTCGATQSNFIRQLGAACAMVGLRCVAAVMDLPYDAAAGKPGLAVAKEGGNAGLNSIFGVELRRFPDDDWEVLFAHASSLALELGAFEIPIGGSSPLGVWAFHQAGLELTESFDSVVFASSSGSTQVGLGSFFANQPTRVIGVAADPEPTLVDDYAVLSAQAAERFPSLPRLRASDFELWLDHVGPGYGVPSPEGQAATEWLARREGILLDPVYSSKAFAGLLARQEEFRGQRVLFWHTGGLPGLFSRT